MKQQRINILKSVLGIVIMAAGYAAILFILRHVLFVEKGYYHSDCTDSILWAQASLDAGRLMNPDFNYAALIPFGGNLIMLPFVAMFGVSVKAQVMGMVTFFALFVLSISLFFKMLGFNHKWIMISNIVILYIASASEKMREIFWGHIIYYSLGLFFLMIGLAIVMWILKKEDMELKKKWQGYAVLFVWTTLCSMNGVQSLTMFSIPVIGAIVAERFFDYDTPVKNKVNVRRGILLGVICLGVIMGLLFGKLANGNIVAGYAEGYSKFSDSTEWMNNLFKVVPSFINLLGFETEDGMLIYSFAGICNLLRIIAAVVIMTVPVIMLLLYKKIKEQSYRIVILTHHFLTLLIMLGWVFGVLNGAEWRLSPVVISSVIVCIVFVKWALSNIKMKRNVLIAGIPVVCLCIITFISMVTLDKHSYYNGEIRGLVKYLEESDLHYGYGTFWNANISTLLSDSKVKIRDITLEDDAYYKRSYQSNDNWYEDAPYYDKYFIVLTNDEYNDYYVDKQIFDEPEEILEHGIFTILVYESNIW